MGKDKMFKAFDIKDIEEHRKKYAAETEAKFGSTEAYRESRRRTDSYSEEDWAAIKSESEAIMKSLAAKMDRDPADREVQELVERWRKHISDRYYNCSKEILAGLGQSYVDDERFQANIDRYGTGLSVYFRDAIEVYCRS